ncbi:NAD-dependent epimerase/dehydratase [Alkalidesulfovibrio alkalitolerans DSM 16529]|jgi:uncharacterized protein (TIGR01777 family)|uniref:NAD-dependent epimerase/dehydratase n=1 Tax=Alkalidesulfovibrio alkalitolerans DSM 16529 TaxID=1121439 RepID=S7TCG8_9BACT|nr:TIGR01777 family oxidoreductase [Alkalidesulfovibrio alkalitolerans]EPR34220.1 NAD-dependent epimerase/dehydratase [Alkalidesulfovibrio alkalitolerans DSM 16529]
MRVIITGGTGLIGRRLTESLLSDGAEVIILSRSVTRVQSLFGGKASAALWDGRSAKDWGQLVDGADAVVNLAGAGLADSRWTPERKKLILESRVNVGRSVTEAISRASVKPKVLVQASAVGYYGPRGLPAVDESAPSGDGFLAEVCRAWEPSTEAVEEMGVRRVIIRTAVVMAEHGGALARMLPIFRLGLGGPLGDGSQGFPWIHLDDEVGAIRFLMQREESRGAYNLAAPETVDNRAFTRALSKTLGRPAVLGAPPFALKLLFGEMAQEALLSGQFVLPRRLTEDGYTFKHPVLLAALEDLLRKA